MLFFWLADWKMYWVILFPSTCWLEICIKWLWLAGHCLSSDDPVQLMGHWNLRSKELIESVVEANDQSPVIREGLSFFMAKYYCWDGWGVCFTVPLWAASGWCMGRMRSKSIADCMRSKSVTDRMRSKSIIDHMRSKSVTDSMWSKYTTDCMRSKSIIDCMQSKSITDRMWSKSITDRMWSKSIIDRMQSKSITDHMRSKSIIDQMWSKSVTDRMRNKTVTDCMWSKSVTPHAKRVYRMRSKSTQTACEASLSQTACWANLSHNVTVCQRQLLFCLFFPTPLHLNPFDIFTFDWDVFVSV